MATYKVSTANGLALNVRDDRNGGNKVGEIPNGTSVNIVRCNATYSTLMFNGTPRFIQHSFLNGYPSTDGAGLSANDAAVSNGSGVTIRSTANGTSTGTSLSLGQAVTVTGSTTTGGYVWYSIGTSKWVRGDYLTPTGTASGGGTGGGGTGVNTATWAQVKAGSGVYKKESSGSAVCEGVKTLQQYLKNIGYGANNVGSIAVDGNFGSITETAVKYFQTECGLTSDGVVGSATATKLEQVQSDATFTNSNYFPLNSTLHTYNTYPYSMASLVARIICAEHGYVRNSGDTDARHGVAKVLKNRVVNGGVTLYDNSKPRDYKNVIFGLNGQYTTANSPLAYRVARGTSAFTEAISLANTIVAGNTPSGASKVTNQIFQKGSSQDNATYQAKSSYARYPTNISPYTFFYN